MMYDGGCMIYDLLRLMIKAFLIDLRLLIS